MWVCGSTYHGKPAEYVGVHSTGNQWSMSGVVLYHSLSYPLETMSLNCKFAIFPKLADQVALRKPPVSVPQCWHYSHIQSYMGSLLCGFWGLNLNSPAHTTSTPHWATSPAPWVHFFKNYELQWAISIMIIKKKTPIYKDIMCIVYQRIKNECLAQANSQD